MEEDQKKMELLSQTINGTASFANYVRIYTSSDGNMTLKFFYVPPSGPSHMLIVSTIVLPTGVGAEAAQATINLIKQQSMQSEVNKPEKTKN